MKRAAACIVTLLAAASAQSAPFADPTRPPRDPEAARAGASAVAPSGPRLESVLIGPDRRIAVINGQQYTEGARFGEGRVLRISESEVIIRQGLRDEALKLYPQSGKRARAVAGGGK